MPRPDEILTQAAALFKDRNALYKSNYIVIGKILAELFPDGLRLESSTDFNRFCLISIILGKMTRYVANWNTGHPDSLRDAAVYSAMLESVDAEFLPSGGIVPKPEGDYKVGEHCEPVPIGGIDKGAPQCDWTREFQHHYQTCPFCKEDFICTIKTLG